MLTSWWTKKQRDWNEECSKDINTHSTLGCVLSLGGLSLLKLLQLCKAAEMCEPRRDILSSDSNIPSQSKVLISSHLS